MKKKQTVLKLSTDNEQKELEFELDYLRRLSFDERLAMMREKSREILKILVERGHRKPFEVVKRS